MRVGECFQVCVYVCACVSVKREGGGEGGVVVTRTHKLSPASKLSISIIMIIIMTTNERHATRKNNVDFDVDNVGDDNDDVDDADAATAREMEVDKKPIVAIAFFFAQSSSFSNCFLLSPKQIFFGLRVHHFSERFISSSPSAPSPEQLTPPTPSFGAAAGWGSQDVYQSNWKGKKTKVG